MYHENLFVLLLLSALPTVNVEAKGFGTYNRTEEVPITDTIPQQQKVVQDVRDKVQEQTGQKVKAIKEVPRAKNLEKPKAIKMPSVKIKPVKLIKPKIKGIGLGK